ncbi:bridge-like lipid transfer protein family member 3B isoform X2 [Lineus longissimus]|uniref:bridge-like lipid transfer protein family member 3B isoform X2 n=1 Tax=Lineus longissimus TaxID=88925 RepID=UPI002B4F47F0
MASIIKNTILKHLSKFTKNLSADKIKLSTLKGEGDLANLELDELMLMELLDLPTWLQIKKAVCNRVSVKVQWTKLKSQPICLFLDEVIVEMETCEKPRGSASSSGNSQVPSYSTEGKYGFSDKVVDGIYLSINSVIVNFVANAFKCSLQLSRVQLKSKTPTWADGDLRMTRIRDPQRGEILLFKELEWLTTRIEASGLEDHKDICSTPLRLIANQAKIRIVIKKRLSDCAIIASRVQLILDDLLWVLTDSQLKEAIMFAQSLKESIAKSAALSKMEASRKVQEALKAQKPGASDLFNECYDFNICRLEQTVNSAQYTSQQGQYSNAQMSQKDLQSNVSKVFTRFDIIETSYHLYTGRIDLHLCGDMSTAAAVSNEYAKLLDSGAMQITLSKLSIDYYPFHPAGGERSHWMKYNEYMINRCTWAQKLLAQFRDDVMMARSKAKPSPVTSPSHGPGPRTPTKQKQTKLLECCSVVRLEDFTFFRVSTADSTRRKPKKFFASDKKQLFLPPEMSAVHIEFTDYYFPEGIDYPVPHSNIFGQINPIHLHLDYLTLIWIQSFAIKLFKSVTPLIETDNPTTPVPVEHKDIRLEALMPRIVLPAEDIKPDEPERPQGLQIQVSKLVITNSRIEEKCSKDQLYGILQELKHGNLFNSSGFPNKEADLIPIPMELLRYAVNGEKPTLDDINEVSEKKEELEVPSSPGSETYFNLSTNSLKEEAAGDVWYIGADQFWLEFTDVPKHKNRPVPFVESFPLNLWVSYPQGLKRDNGKKSRNDSRSSLKKLKQFYSLDSNSSTEDPFEGSAFKSMESTSLTSPATMNLFVNIPAKVFVQLDHYQFVFLMRLVDTVTKYQTEIEKITKASFPSAEASVADAALPPSTVCVSLSLEELEVAMLCPPMVDRNESMATREPPESPSFDSSSAKHNDETCSSVTDDQPTSPDSPSSDPARRMNGTLEIPTAISKSYSDSEILNVPSISEPKSDVTDYDRGQQAPMTSMMSPSHSQKGTEIKKSFSSAFSSFDTAISKGFDKIKQTLDVSDDSSQCEEWETSSIKSSMSEEDDDFLVITLGNAKETAAFRHQRHESNASGSDATKDDDATSLTTLNMSHHLDPLKNKMNVTTFRILHAELIAQVKGQDVSVKLQVQHIMPNAMGNILPEEFQSKFNLGPKDSIDKPPRLEYFPIKLRFDTGPSAEQLSPGSLEKGFLHIKAKDVMLDIAMSSVQGLGEVMEEEVVPPTIPMLIEVNNTQISMMEDRPPSFRHTAAPIPVDLLIQNLVIRRNEDGVINIQGGPRPMSLKSISSISLPTPDSATFSANPEMSPTQDEKDEGSESLLLRLVSSKKEMHQKDRTIDGLRNQIEKLKLETSKMTEVQEKYNQLTEQVEVDGVSNSALLEKVKMLELENRQFVEEVSKQADELRRLRDDYQSQASALMILQEELIAVEQRGKDVGGS